MNTMSRKRRKRKISITTVAANMMSTPVMSNAHTGDETDKWSQDLAAQDGIARLSVEDNPLFDLTPNELKGTEVVGTDRKRFGTIRDIVGSKTSNDAYAVVRQGGFMGLGVHEFLISLDELTLVKSGLVRAEFNENIAAARPKYNPDDYSLLDSNRPVFDYFYLHR